MAIPATSPASQTPSAARAEARVQLGELAADDAAADHNEARRHLARGRRIAARPELERIEAGDRREGRNRPGRDDERVVFERVPVRFDDPGLVNSAHATDEV